MRDILEASQKKSGSQKSAIVLFMGHKALNVVYLRIKDKEMLETLVDVEEGGVDKLDVDKQILFSLHTVQEGRC